MRVPAGVAVAVSSPSFVDADLAPAEVTEATLVATSLVSGAEVPTADVSPIVDRPGRLRSVLGPVAALGPVSLLWSATVGGGTQSHIGDAEVVGGWLASIDDVQSHPDLRHAPVTAEEVWPILDEFAELIEDYRGASWVARCAVEDLDHDSNALRWPLVRQVVSAEDEDGQPVEISGTVGAASVLCFAHRRPRGRLRVAYIHGAATVPALLRRAAVGYVAATVVADRAGVARDALWETTESGTIRYSTPDKGRGRPTGLILPDRALNALADHRRPGIA